MRETPHTKLTISTISKSQLFIFMDVGILFSVLFTLGDIVTVIDLLYMGEKREEDPGMKFRCA